MPPFDGLWHRIICAIAQECNICGAAIAAGEVCDLRHLRPGLGMEARCWQCSQEAIQGTDMREFEMRR